MKKAIISAIVLVYCFSISASAVSLTDTIEETSNVLPQSSIEQIDLMFNNMDQYSIFDVNGKDITHEFYTRHNEDYSNGDYKLITGELCKQNLTVSKPVVYTMDNNSLLNISPRTILNRTATDEATAWVVDGQYWVKFIVEGDYRLYDSNGRIESASVPRVVSNSQTTNLPTARTYDYQIFWEGKTPSITTDGYRACFFVKYDVYVTSKAYLTPPPGHHLGSWLFYGLAE